MSNFGARRLLRVAVLGTLIAAGCGESSGTGGGTGSTSPTGPNTIVPHFPGAGSSTGTGGATGATSVPPLTPGCTPASASECPTATGSCASGAGGGSRVSGWGTTCYFGPASSTMPAATVEYIQEVAGGQDYYRFRVTFDPGFVDNTYGVGAIGWATSARGAHTFKDLVGSDHAQLQLSDAAGTQVMDLKLDYISEDASRDCGYGTLGVSGGEGKVLAGDPAWVLAAASSLDRNLNGCGYCQSSACGGGSCTVDSPLTDAAYTANAATPKWDYRVQYEVWIDSDAFGSRGFGAASITFVHASPSKAATNTVTVTRGTCPRTWRRGCPAGTTQTVDEDGTIRCGSGCPEGWEMRQDEFGQTFCVPPGTVIIVP